MSRRPSPVGPVVMIVPLLSLIAGSLWMRARVGTGPPPGVPAVVDPDAMIEGWRTPEGTGVVAAELFPLHAQPERQAFEAQRLAERLDLEPGEPFRLRLAQAATEHTIDPASVAVRIEAATVLAVVRPGPAARRGPLATLLAPPTALDPGGRVVEIVLWGEAPDSQPTLVVQDVSGTELTLELEPLERPRRELPAFLARLDPEERGKESEDVSSTSASGNATPELSADDER